MRKLALSLVSILAAGSLLVACSDDGGKADGPKSEGIRFDGGTEVITPMEAGGDTVQADLPKPTCDPTTVGKYWEETPCASDADCAGVGTGKCDTANGVCEETTNPCGENTPFGLGYNEDGKSSWGLCTCSCTPDDASTPLVNEDSCPDQAKNMCSDPITYLSSACQSNADCDPDETCDTARGRCKGEQSYCVRKCDPTLGTRTCDGKMACKPTGGYNFGMYFDTVCADKGCEADDDCPVSTGVSCDTHQDDCPDNGGKCYLADYKSECTGDTDCTTGYWCKDLGTASDPAKYCVTVEGSCYKPGKCDTASGLCDVKPAGLFKAGAKIGDACNGDVDCDQNQSCAREVDNSKYLVKIGQPCKDDSECCSYTCTNGTCAAGYNYCTVTNRNGYCTIKACEYASTLTIAACPAGSDCNQMYAGGGECQKTCTIADATTCRNNPNDLWGDYECRDYTAFGATKGPVCDGGTDTFTCAAYQNSGGDCSALGDSTNSTNMSCRGLDGQPKTNKFDKTGFCFDDTASGTQKRNPLPTP